MFDLNTIITQALNAAVAEAVKPLVNRIDELENLLVHRVTALETKLTEAALFEKNTNVTIPIDEAKMVEALNSQEWFWEKLHNTINDNVSSRVEEALDDHCSTYDHDDYDRHISDDSIHVEHDLEDAINRALRNASIEIRI